MFTGITKETGRISGLSRGSGLSRLALASENIYKEANAGDSVSVNGVCLTVIEKKKETLYFDVSKETLARTTIGELKDGDLVNLEGSLKAGDPLGGHFVLGHVDCVGVIKKKDSSGDEVSIEIEVPGDFERLMVRKGSVTVDGISLTIGEVEKGRFRVYMIPHTLKVTTLGKRKNGDKVNIEFDIIGKHVARLREPLHDQSRINENFLREKGF